MTRLCGSAESEDAPAVWDFQSHAAQVIKVLQQAGWRLEYGKPGASSAAIPLKDYPTVQ